MPTSLSDVYGFLQAASWAVAAGAGLFGVYKYFPEAKEKRLWEKAKLAKEMVDDLSENMKAMDASYMLGAWHGRQYQRQEDGEFISFRVTEEQVIAVLDDPARIAQSSNDQYIRECFDELFYHIDLCATAAERKIIDWADIKPLLITLFAGVHRSMLPSLHKFAISSRYYWAADKMEELVEGALTHPVRKPG